MNCISYCKWIARKWWKQWPGPLGTGIGRRTATTSTANVAYARSIGARFLSTRLESAEVVDPKQQKKLDQVFFGATVTYADGHGNAKTITIVGIDEADFSRGQVSWVSPVARALMKAQEGDIVDVRAPSGVEQIEVLKIRYGGARGESE